MIIFYLIKYPAAGNGIFDPHGSRQISAQMLMLDSLLAVIKKLFHYVHDNK